MQQLPDVEKTDSTDGISFLNWTIYKGRRKVYVNNQTDGDEFNIVVCRYWNNLYLKDSEMHLSIT